MHKTSLRSILDQDRALISEIETILKYFEPKKLNKGEYFIEAGQVCRNVGFIESGLVLYYEIDNSGQAVTCDFAKETDWITQYESFINQSPSVITIEALEPTELQVISSENLYQLFAKVPSFEQHTRKIIEKMFISSLARNNDMQVLKAEKRYAKFVEENPSLIQRVPQYHIASFLGIAPQSLSRIRNNFTPS